MEVGAFWYQDRPSLLGHCRNTRLAVRRLGFPLAVRLVCFLSSVVDDKRALTPSRCWFWEIEIESRRELETEWNGVSKLDG